MILTFEDFKRKFKPITGSNVEKPRIFRSNEKEVREKKSSNMVWNINQSDKSVMKILPNKKQFITFGICLITEIPFTQHQEENLKVMCL